MNVGVMGDTHGESFPIKRAIEALEEIAKIDMWLHTGDYNSDIRYVTQLVNVPIVGVSGNCDFRTQAHEDEFLDLEGTKIWLTHGHRHKVKYEKNELIWWAKHYEVDAVVYGHSHIPDLTWEGDILLFNPGSTCHPRFDRPTCGLLQIEQAKIHAQIIEL